MLLIKEICCAPSLECSVLTVLHDNHVFLISNLHILFYTSVLDLFLAFRCFSGGRIKCAEDALGVFRVSQSKSIMRSSHKGISDFFFASSRQFIPALLLDSASSVLPLSSNSTRLCRCKQPLSNSTSYGPRLSGRQILPEFQDISHNSRSR